MDDMRAQIESLLRKFWTERAIAINEDPTSIDELGAPLDSLASLEAIMEIDDLVQRKLPIDRIIRKGGYENENDFVSDVTTKVLDVLEEIGNE